MGFTTVSATKGGIEVKVNGVGNVGARNIYKIGSLYGGKISEQKALKSKLLNDIKSLKVDKSSTKVNFKYQNEIFNKNKKL